MSSIGLVMNLGFNTRGFYGHVLARFTTHNTGICSHPGFSVHMLLKFEVNASIDSPGLPSAEFGLTSVESCMAKSWTRCAYFNMPNSCPLRWLTVLQHPSPHAGFENLIQQC